MPAAVNVTHGPLMEYRRIARSQRGRIQPDPPRETIASWSKKGHSERHAGLAAGMGLLQQNRAGTRSPSTCLVESTGIRPYLSGAVFEARGRLE
jgi:hypothetical protein